MSLDRFDPAVGYVAGNVNVICYACNAIKSNATLEALESLVRWMKEVKERPLDFRIENAFPRPAWSIYGISWKFIRLIASQKKYSFTPMELLALGKQLGLTADGVRRRIERYSLSGIFIERAGRLRLSEDAVASIPWTTG